MDVDSDPELLSEDDYDEEEVESEDSNSEERALELKVSELEYKIAQNRYFYQPYLELINTLKKLTDFDRLRSARIKMSNQFPLSPELWSDWIQDEVNVATTPEEKQYIIDLFDLAVKDYLSVDIWLQYVTFMMCFQNEQSPGKCTQTRKVFEEALTAAGLHVIQGSLIWETYIEYEQSNLVALKDKPEEYENQLKLIANLYKRQLSCPLKGMEDTYEKFQKWLNENSKDGSEPLIDKTIVENVYKKAKEKLNKIWPFEKALLSYPKNTSTIYSKYLEHEKSKEGSPVRVQCLYERILCENCLDEDFWLEYIEYTSTVLKNGEAALSICKRSLKNCSWVCKLYQAYLKCLEKFEQPKSALTRVVEDAFECGLKKPTDFRDIWMSYLEYLRRYFDCPNIDKEEEEKRLEELRSTFSQAFDYISQLEHADPACVIAQFWARIEANYCKNMAKSRELWNVILSRERNKTAEMWLEYIHLERTFGDSKHLKKLFPRALENTKDWPESIGKVWANYERDEGTLESFEMCLKKIKARVKDVKEQRRKEPSNAEGSRSSDFASKKFKKGAVPKPKETNQTESSYDNENKSITGYKRSHTDQHEETSPSKKPRVDENDEESVDKEETNEEFVKKLIEESNKDPHGETVVHDSSKDHRTVFVSNLDFATEESTIREVFSSCGTITDLRLVRDYKGRSKGFCYVEYEKSKEAQDALKKDRELINGRPMFVSKCDPDKETRGNAFKYSSGLEKNKIFIRGLPFTTTTDDLRNLFSTFGTLKDVRLVTYRNGHSKGLAYVEFEDEAAAAQAVLKTDGTMIQDKQISVAISNPPGRKTETSLLSNSTPSLGGGLKESGPRGRGRTQISFVPRSVQLNKPSTATDSLASLSITSPVPENEQTKFNNSDFRKLLG